MTPQSQLFVIFSEIRYNFQFQMIDIYIYIYITTNAGVVLLGKSSCGKNIVNTVHSIVEFHIEAPADLSYY